jgi:arylsulfatase A-like enzyme
MEAPKSLVLVTIDCLRADHVGFHGYDRPTTPFLDALAGESIVVENAIVAGAPTYYSFPAIMASRYPLALGRDVIGLARGESTIASVLSESGYATGAFLAANPYLSRRFGYDAGFEVFRDFLDAGRDLASGVPDETQPDAAAPGRWNRRLRAASHKLGAVGAVYDEIYFQYCQRLAGSPAKSFDALRRFPSADGIVRAASAWITENQGRPLFLWLHFMDPHSPYYPRAEALDLMGNPNLSSVRARYLNSYWNRGEIGTRRFMRHRKEVISLYDAGVRWADSQVAVLVDVLRAAGRWKDCALAVTADHGEEFLDHGGRYHPPNQLAEELIRVPLLLRVPGTAKAVQARGPVSLLHLAPTLLDVLNISAPASFRGRSHWKKLQSGQIGDDPAVVECIHGCTNPFRPEERMGARVLAIREARYKLVIDVRSSKEELFDLQADPGEFHPLAPQEQKPTRRRLLERARRHVVESVQSRDATHRLDARLRDLQLEWAHSMKSISA